MGRKMKSTKSGKYINPTDQARKEARKRELKKNKKQRLIVRIAVLKGKDPYQIIADLERFDRMEYDFSNPSPLNEKVLRDKRRKLKDTWDRICKFYSKEDKEKFLELKRLEKEYLVKKNLLIKEYEAIKSTQDVNIEDIPLPASMPEESKEVVISSILKNSKIKKEPPGCPPGLPPILDIVIDENEDEESENEEEICENKSKRKIKFSDEIEKTSKEGSNLQKFLKEIEQISSEKEKNVDKNTDTKPDAEEVSQSSTNQTVPVNQPNVFFGATPLQPPQPYLPIMPNEFTHPALMPNPSPLIPVPIVNPTNPMFGQVHTSNVYNSYTGMLNNPENKQQATIEARPQLRNLSVELTKFTPLALRVRRDEKQVQKKPVKHSAGYGMLNSLGPSTSVQMMNELKNQDKVNSKDDAYEEFMKEMNGLI